MLSRRKPSFALRSTGVFALLLGCLVLPLQALASVEIERNDAAGYDAVLVSHGDSGSGYTLRNSRFTVDDLQKLREQQKRHDDELDSLKKIIKEQANAIEALKRGVGSGSGSMGSELSALRRTVNEQGGSIDKLARAVDELKRNAGSSSGSGSGDLSALKRTVDEQDRTLDKLGRTVDELKRNSGSGSSASELSGLKRDVGDQGRELDNLQRKVDDLSRKVK